MSLVLQIVEYNTTKGMITDIWESSDRKLLLRCAKDSQQWAPGFTYSVYDTATSRNWDLRMAIPKGCKVARPCVDGVDFLTWNPDAPKVEETTDHAINLTEDERKLMINLLSTHTPAFDGPATRLLNKLKDLNCED